MSFNGSTLGLERFPRVWSDAAPDFAWDPGPIAVSHVILFALALLEPAGLRRPPRKPPEGCQGLGRAGLLRRRRRRLPAFLSQGLRTSSPGAGPQHRRLLVQLGGHRRRPNRGEVVFRKGLLSEGPGAGSEGRQRLGRARSLGAWVGGL